MLTFNFLEHVPAAKYRRYVKSRAEATRVPTPLPVMRVEIGPEDWNSDTDEDNIPTEASEMQHPSYQEGSSSARQDLEDLLPSGSPTSSSLASVVQRRRTSPVLPPETSNGDSSREKRCSSKCSSNSPLPSHHGSEAGSQVSDAGSNNTDHLLSSTLTNPYLVQRPARRARDLLYGSSASRSRDASPTGVPTRTNYFRGYERPPPITVPDIAPTLRRTPRRYGAGGRSYSFFKYVSSSSSTDPCTSHDYHQHQSCPSSGHYINIETNIHLSFLAHTNISSVKFSSQSNFVKLYIFFPFKMNKHHCKLNFHNGCSLITRIAINLEL